MPPLSRDRAIRMLAGDPGALGLLGDTTRLRHSLGGISSRRVLLRGDPGLGSFLGGLGRSFLGLPPASSASQVVGAVQRGMLMPPVTAAQIALRGGGLVRRVLGGVVHAVPISRRALPGTRSGAPSAGAAGAGAMVMHRRRRMRVTNPRALRRAMRRVFGFARLAHQTISFTKRVKMRRRRGAAAPFARRR